MDITSLQNPRVKHIVKLREDKKQRARDGLMIVEGVDEIKLALSAGHQPQTLLTAPELASTQISFLSAETLTVSQPVFEKLSYRDNPDGWLAVFPIPRSNLEDLKLSQYPLIIVAESIEKPGNLGAILRTADAAGVDAVIVCDPQTDFYNPNVVRSSLGCVFTQRIASATSDEAIAWLKKRDIRIYCTYLKASRPYHEVDFRGPSAIVMGTEATGLSDAWVKQSDANIIIPMQGTIDSMNVSTATAVVVFEARRQRGFLSPPQR